MSKRAEALWNNISEAIDWDYHGDEESVVALIDAELRKEREACAVRGILWLNDDGAPPEEESLRSAILEAPDA
jgi:hypothetical protein